MGNSDLESFVGLYKTGLGKVQDVLSNSEENKETI